MMTPDEQNNAPLVDDTEESEGNGGQAQPGRFDSDDDSPMRKHRVLGQHTIIDGERYSEADDEGGYGQVEVSDRYAKQMQKRGVRLKCLGPFEEGEDASNYGEKYDPEFDEDEDDVSA